MSLDKERQDDWPIGSRADLLAYFRRAEKPRPEHRLGLEHEKLLFPAGGVGAVPYEGACGVAALLSRLERQGCTAFRESPDGPVIALECGQATISLEPGGQLELSGTPWRTAREAHAENVRHIRAVIGAGSELGLRAAAIGYRPFGELDQMPWMPKARYQVMRQTLGPRGRLAFDMMLMTATGQVSLDFADEADCARKISAISRAAPLMVALYANSPIARGRLTGYASYRSRVWSEVDPPRAGYLPAAVEGRFSYEAYVEWALDAPLLFLRRRGAYVTPGVPFRELLAHGYEGRPATQGDWVDHLSTLFPEVRLKTVLEIRGADGVGAELTGALLALWRGALYDAQALAEVEGLLPRLTFPEHLELHETARRDGLRGEFRGRPLAAWAAELVEIARRGLRRLDEADLPLLDPLAEVAASGRSPSDGLVELWSRSGDPAALVDAVTLRAAP